MSLDLNMQQQDSADMGQSGLTPVTHARHGHKFWRRAASFDFARYIGDCPIVESELSPVAAAFPIAFRDAGEGPELVALLSLEQSEETPFVSSSGAWLAAYVPSVLRCVPFHAGLVPKSEGGERNQYRLIVDETTGLITDDPKDEPFYAATGTLAPELQNVMHFLRARAASMQATRRLCRLIGDLNLLRPLKRMGSVICPSGLLGIDDDVFQSLSQPRRTVLMNSGALRLIHAQQISLAHGVWLASAQRQRARGKSKPPSEASDFLNAFAQAQNACELTYLAGSEGPHVQY